MSDEYWSSKCVEYEVQSWLSIFIECWSIRIMWALIHARINDIGVMSSGHKPSLNRGLTGISKPLLHHDQAVALIFSRRSLLRTFYGATMSLWETWRWKFMKVQNHNISLCHWLKNRVKEIRLRINRHRQRDNLVVHEDKNNNSDNDDETTTISTTTTITTMMTKR